ncbi:hypothetical protein PNH50_04165 [Leisingera aquaemixtae]|uniref:hypothetical protein n=1 Tax=Leisingera aquaemixtae TaxID=1396826 RepID=UPI0039843432
MKINHGKLDALLGKILDAHQTGEVSRNEAIGAIAHVVAAVEKGNETEVHSWLNNEEVYERWLKMVKSQ